MELSPELSILGSLQEVGFNMFEEETYAYTYELAQSAEHGDAISFVIKIDNGFFEVRDTITKIFSAIDIVFEESGEDIESWETTGASQWGVTDEDALTGETSLTDSPYGFYESSSVSELVLLDPIDLEDALSAELHFSAKWDIEEIIDYAVVEASSDGVNFTTLCGEHANSSHTLGTFETGMQWKCNSKSNQQSTSNTSHRKQCKVTTQHYYRLRSTTSNAHASATSTSKP